VSTILDSGKSTNESYGFGTVIVENIYAINTVHPNEDVTTASMLTFGQATSDNTNTGFQWDDIVPNSEAWDWDFGDNTQNPVLKVDFDGDGTATWEEFGTQPR